MRGRATGHPAPVAEVSASSELEGLAQAIAKELAALCGVHATFFIRARQPPPDALGPSISSDSSDRHAPLELGPLARWLRVNACGLPVPDPWGVVADLPPAEANWLRAQAIAGCIPLVQSGELLAVVFLRGGAGAWKPTPTQRRAVDVAAAQAAEVWSRQLLTRQAADAREAAYRSQQLATTGQLAASVAHEVRNPLAGIRSMVQLVRDTRPEAETHGRLLSDVLLEIDRIDGRVSGLLGLARRQPAAESRCDLCDVARASVAFMQAFARRQGTELLADLPSAPLMVSADPLELRQVLLNLLLNACQASPAGGRVRVSAPNGPAGIGLLCVADEGAGIDAGDLERVFHPFFTTKLDGTGLGLSVSRDLIRGRGGDMRIESNLGVGTMVTLQLPLADPSDGAHPRR